MTAHFASQHTQSFPELLRQLGSSVLVSTYQAGQLIILRASDTVLNTHFCSLEKPMGMTAQRDKLAVGTGFQVSEYRNMAAVAEKLEGPEHHDACYLPRHLHITGDIDIHEMAYAADGELWLVNTRMSCLCTLDGAYSVVPRWRPAFVSAFDLTDRCHLNGLALQQGAPAYATALGETDRPGGWRENKAGGGCLIDIAQQRIVGRGLSMPHSPRCYDGKLWFLESGAGTLCTIDPATGERETIAELPGFTRGLDFAGRFAFVGLSQVRETAVFAGLPLTSRVAQRRCGVYVVDIVERSVVAYVVFEGGVQEVFAVQLLPARFPALLDLDDPLVRNSYALPDDALGQVASVDPTQLALERAATLHRQGERAAAIAAYRAVLDDVPDLAIARYQLALVLCELEQWAEAEDEFLVVLQHQPDNAEAHNRLGVVCNAQHRVTAAMAHFQNAIATDAQFAAAHVNRGLLLLAEGNYSGGWDEYEWRWQTPEVTPLRCSQPQWKGQPIAGKTLLVHSEQGAGEVLQFARFFPPAAALCGKLIVLCPEPLRDLLAVADGVAEARLMGDIASDAFDYYIPLMSLPRVLGTTLDNLPKTVPYLRVPEHAGRQLPSANGAYRIGIVWRGRDTDDTNRRHWLPLAQLQPLFTLPGAAFYNLQKPMTAAESDLLERCQVTNLEPELVDYARTAAFLSQLDLIISVDTSVAHLAGALGKPVWLMLARQPEWCWLRDRDDSPWYPTATLFRQAEPGQWGDVVGRVRAALAAAGSSSPGKLELG